MNPVVKMFVALTMSAAMSMANVWVPAMYYLRSMLQKGEGVAHEPFLSGACS